MEQQASTLPFASTGPQGHRGRMRTRLLDDETALADYEILEMLLFLGIPRRDTKPLAKSLINRFGSLGATLAVAADQPGTLDLPTRAAEALFLVRQSATALARPEAHDRKRLDNWDTLLAHLDLASRANEPPGFSALLLNSRNQLIAEPDWPGANPPDLLPREVMRRALDRHASAVLMVRSGTGRPRLTPADRTLHLALKQAAAALSVVVHDYLVTGGGKWISMRQSGLA